MAISCPDVSTTKTLSPATHGGCMPGTLSDHSRSPVAACVAIMRPAWPTANTVPLSIAGRAASLIAVISDVVRVRVRLSDHAGRAVGHMQGHEIAGGIGHHHDIAVDGRARVVDEACLLRQPARRPQLAAVGAGQAVEAPIERHDEHLVSGRRRRGAHRRLQQLLPQLLARLRIERDDIAVSARRIKAPVVDSQAAAVAAATAAADRARTSRRLAFSRSGFSATRHTAEPPEVEKALTLLSASST